MQVGECIEILTCDVRKETRHNPSGVFFVCCTRIIKRHSTHTEHLKRTHSHILYILVLRSILHSFHPNVSVAAQHPLRLATWKPTTRGIYRRCVHIICMYVCMVHSIVPSSRWRRRRQKINKFSRVAFLLLIYRPPSLRSSSTNTHAHHSHTLNMRHNSNNNN